MKRNVPIAITFIVGAILVIAYFTPFVGNLGELAMIHFDILAAIAFVLGGGNLLRIHGEKVFKRRAGWGYSFIAVASFLAMLGFGLFKFGVLPLNQGFWTDQLMRSGETVGLAQLNISGPAHELKVTVRKAQPNSRHDVTIDGILVGTIKVGEKGRGDLDVKYNPEKAEAGVAALGEVQPNSTIKIGNVLSGTLVHYSRLTGDHLENGGGFWYLYQYAFKPLQMTTFAMLAFYVASAAYRAFRAKNVESVLLLGTAFVILLGRTYAGAFLTSFLADPLKPPDGLWEQFLSFFYIPNLTQWFMNVFNTAGNRAIMIGIALGIASTSLKVILGIDRSYLGSEK